jgi:hypothetical protein
MIDEEFRIQVEVIDLRTTWISFWKAMALLQFGTTLVFGVPPLWNNTNQPDERVRKMQAITGK